MSELFGRVAVAEITSPRTQSTQRIQGLRIVFRVLKDAATTMNSAEVSIYNLSQATRDAVAVFADVLVLRVGYESEGEPVRVSAGVITQMTVSREGADIVTKFSTNDGYRAIRDSVTSRTYGPGYSAIAALKAVVSDMALPILFIADVPDRPFLTGWQYSGPSFKALNSLANRLNLELIVEDQALKLVKYGTVAKASTSLTAPLISPATGLIGSLEKNSMLKDSGKTVHITSKNAIKVDERHGWRFRCLLNPRLQPADAVVLQGLSLALATGFRLEKVEHVGDTHGQDWVSECITSEKAIT